MNPPVLDANRERGAALATVLTMLAVMSMIAVVVIEAASMSIRRTDNIVRMEQTRWYLIGAEAFALAHVRDLNGRPEGQDLDPVEWEGRRFAFPLDDGEMEIVLRDGGNCFNLNSLVVAEDSGRLVINPAGVVQFSRLLDLSGVDAAQGGLAAALVDWLDSDNEPTAGGAEDVAYAQMGATRLPANTLLADVSELRHVLGFNDETTGRIASLVCVRPTPAANALNPNTLSREQAPLLVSALGELSVDQAVQIIRERPRGGWRTIDDFFHHPLLADLELNAAGRAQFQLRPRYFVLHARVARDRANEYGAALIEAGAGGDAAVIRRVFGVAQAEHML